MLIGFAFGVYILFVFAFTQRLGVPEWVSYLLSFVPSRFMEWFALFYLFSRSRGLAFDAMAKKWVAVGVAVSLVSDLVAWFVLEFTDANIKFFC